MYLDVIFSAKLKFNYFHLTLNDFDIRVSNLHNNRFVYCLSIRLSPIISTLLIRFAYGIHFLTMLLLLEQFMSFVVYYLMLIL